MPLNATDYLHMLNARGYYVQRHTVGHKPHHCVVLTSETKGAIVGTGRTYCAALRRASIDAAENEAFATELYQHNLALARKYRPGARP